MHWTIRTSSHANLKHRPSDDQQQGAREKNVQIPCAVSSSSPRNRSIDHAHFSVPREGGTSLPACGQSTNTARGASTPAKTSIIHAFAVVDDLRSHFNEGEEQDVNRPQEPSLPLHEISLKQGISQEKVTLSPATIKTNQRCQWTASNSRRTEEHHGNSTGSQHLLRPSESSERLPGAEMTLTRTALSTTVRPTTPQLRYVEPAPEQAGAPKKGLRDAKPLTRTPATSEFPRRMPSGMLSVEVPHTTPRHDDDRAAKTHHEGPPRCSWRSGSTRCQHHPRRSPPRRHQPKWPGHKPPA